MKVIQSRSFQKKVKKFTKAHKAILDEVVREIIKNPDIGEQKKGDLKDVLVHKFKLGNSQYLLAYRYSKNLLELIMIGFHQNYHRDLKTYLKNV
ncbi:MAG: type II toxin-antitoxin system RelE/ParE family toxin [Bacteroidales bacterium]|nr:type II toxin-antitoxin system RelE/ParE family toxin [Bacteroidales bacterium]